MAELILIFVAGLSQEQAGALAELFGGQHSLLGEPKRACIANLIAFFVHRSEDTRLWPQLCTVRYAFVPSLQLILSHRYVHRPRRPRAPLRGCAPLAAAAHGAASFCFHGTVMRLVAL